jgi:5-methylcytosine-specific restriction endonuclease McrA
VAAQKLIITMPINYKKYPANWKSEIVPRIKQRDGHCCKFCGIENYTIKQNGTKVILTVAHLDHDSQNHNVQDERLAALCQACHLKYDLSRHIAKRKYGMAFFEQPTLF